MTGRRIKLNNGTVYEGGECGYADGFLWCFIKDRSIQDVALVFLDEEATRVIEFEYGTMKDVYTGFTSVFSFQTQDPGCAVCMTKPTAEV